MSTIASMIYERAQRRLSAPSNVGRAADRRGSGVSPAVSASAPAARPTSRRAPSRSRPARAADHRAAPDLDLWQRVFFLRTVPLFEALDPDRLRLVAEISRSVTAEQGEGRVREGGVGHHFYLVCRGSAEVRVGGATVAQLPVTGAIGELALLTGERRAATVAAREECDLVTIDRVNFLDLIEAHPALVEPFSKMIAVRSLNSLHSADA